MPLYSIGDLASSFLLRRQNVHLNSELGRLSQEMASGVAADIPRHLDGNYSYLGDLERDLLVNEGYTTAATEAALFISAMQTTLDRVQQTATTLSSDLILSGNTTLPEAMQTASNNAADQLQSLLSALNTNVAGRALFSGAATDSSSFSSANAFLANLKTAVAGEVTLSGILTVIDSWFDAPGGGFETNGYLGATIDLSPFPVGTGETLNLDLRGDNQTIRDLLKNTAIAAIAADSTLGYSSELQGMLLVEAGENLMTSQGELTGIRADLGYAEARIEESRTRLSAEKTSLEMARGELLGVDLYDTATQLENVQFQLESLYTATARLSQLSLVEYL
ncbi:flagellin [Alisedimentitalea sp. MJ-SS2]|uniref:flagellin n=1 Tax=Aliisedimentitalea sp. MJ-SS2 TaxID=3049795 RepID=UPI002912CD9A|nr:flagellin [Alisedimentitalea sp. MJ-SS2]MDU8929628.1 flagellin [Alisedimentitalea sp. MJ-SS2]